MGKNDKAVAAMLDQAMSAATLETMRGRLGKLTEGDFPSLACLIDLLAEHPGVVNNDTLAGSVSAIQGLFRNIWDDIEQVAA